MPRIIEADELRKQLGIKKLRRKIPISDFEKAAIKNLGEEGRRRVERAHKIKA
jgi:hypothetical protein